MTKLRYRIVDVFTTEPLQGNALAVFPDAPEIDDKTMQAIAKEMNLSETVFLYPASKSDWAARVRIFTPVRELAFAGHPTVGTSFVLLDEERVAKGTTDFVLEEKIGPVPIRVDYGERPLIWLRTPPIEWRATFDRKQIAAAIGLSEHDMLPMDPQILSAGNPTLLIAVHDKEAVDRAAFKAHQYSQIEGETKSGVCNFIFAPVKEGAYSRMFAPELGVVEDPATGSSTGPLAAYMMKHGLVSDADGTKFYSEQGVSMGRRSILYVSIHGANGSTGIDVGGYVTPIAAGEMTI